MYVFGIFLAKHYHSPSKERKQRIEWKLISRGREVGRKRDSNLGGKEPKKC